MFKVASFTHIGKVKLRNEDAYLCKPEEGFFVLCDGMGGHVAGNVASSLAVQEIYDAWGKGKDLKSCIFSANELLLRTMKENVEYAGMGTTALILHIGDDNNYKMVWVGDSRGYIFTNGHLIRLTEDHTFVNSLLINGAITEEEAKVHPYKNMLLQALGGISGAISPGVLEGKAKDEDIFLLCSDGLINEISEEYIEAELVKHKSDDLKSLVTSLVEKANENGGNDNITALLVKKSMV